MGKVFWRGFCRLTVPGGLLLLAWAVAFAAGLLRHLGPSFWVYYPYAFFGAALLLSAIFNRSRLFFAALALTLADRALVYWMPQLTSIRARGALFDAITFLVPLNFLALSFVRDRGIVSPRGRKRMGLAAIQIVSIFLVLFVRPLQTLAEKAVHSPIVPRQYSDWSRVSEWNHMSEAALLVFGLCAIAMVTYLLYRRQPAESGLFWALIAAFVALDNAATPHMASLFFCIGGLILAVAVLEASYTMAYRDELTQLPSRRALNETLLKLGESYALAMLDVDHFKSFNDSYGHATGDQVLQMIAARLRAVSGGGKAFRYGGEEFCVVFPNRSLDEAYPSLEALRKEIEHSKFMVRGRDRRRTRTGIRRAFSSKGKKRVVVTVSIGAAAVSGAPVKADDVLRAADKALYRAKNSGRNCTVTTELVHESGTQGLASRARQALSY